MRRVFAAVLSCLLLAGTAFAQSPNTAGNQLATSSAVTKPQNYSTILYTTSGNISQSWPTAVGKKGIRVTVKKVSSDQNTITITPNGSETVEGLTALRFNQKDEAYTLESDGANWSIVWKNQPYDSQKQYLLNPSGDFLQRGSVSVVEGSYGFDRWKGYSVNTAYNSSRNFKAVQISGDTPNSDAKYSMEIQTAGGAADIGTMGICQRMEAATVRELAGRVVSVSFWFKRISAGNSGTFLVTHSPASSEDTFPIERDSFTSIVNLGTFSAAPASWTKYVASFVAPTSWSNGASFCIFPTRGSSITALTTDAAQFRIAQVTLNQGPVPASYKLAGGTLGGELLLCQRYYEKSFPVTVTPAFGGAVSSGNAALFTARAADTNDLAAIRFTVEKRVTPTTVTTYGYDSTGQFYRFGAGGSTAASPANINTRGFGLALASAAIAGNTYGVGWTADAEL